MTQAKSYKDILISQFLQTRSQEFLMADIHLGLSVNIDKRQIELRDEVYIFENETSVIDREYTPETWVVVFMLKGTNIIVGLSTANMFEVDGLRRTLLRMLSGNQIQIIKRRHFFKVKSLLSEDMRNKRRVADEHSDCVYNSEVIDIGFFPLRNNPHLQDKVVTQKSDQVLMGVDLF